MLNLKHIAEGWFNVAFPKKATEDLARQRAKVCMMCPRAKEKTYLIDLSDEREELGYVCEICNCPLVAKLRVKEETCPENKW